MSAYEKIGLGVILFVIVTALNLLMAFPFMWTWNYAMTRTFGLPEINWLSSFCLLLIFHMVFPQKITEKG